MARRFLDTLTLASLVAPISEAEFREHYWERAPLVVRRQDRGYYGDLFTLKDFDDAVCRHPAYISAVNAATKDNNKFKPTVKGFERLLDAMRAGDTLLLDQLHRSNPNLAELCSVLGAEIGVRLHTNLYLTPAHGQGFAPHWDNHDVFILQVVGSKDWRIEKERRHLPTHDELFDGEDAVFHGEPLSFTLEQGDLIYIPRGFVHAASCGDESSLHITLGFASSGFPGLLKAVLKAAILRDPNLESTLPLGFLQEDAALLAGQVKTALRQAADRGFLASVIDQYRDELVRTFPLDVTGQIAEHVRRTPVALESEIGPRRGTIYRLHDGEDSVRLAVGARNVVFPGFFGPALHFALETPSYKVAALPGDIEDEERIAFIERLMEEGLVIRQDAG